jgi:nucleotide-binding universal stress UspA family protein
MTYTTIHLHLTPYPSPTSTGAINYACALAKLLEARLEVSSSHLAVKPPANWLAGAMMGRIAGEVEATIAKTTDELESHLSKEALAASVQATLTPVAERWPAGAEDCSWRGRVSDVCVLGLPPLGADGRFGVEDWLFGSGRPCLLYPDNSQQTLSLEHVLVCWDFSKSAARAVVDALPLLQNATRVHIAVFRGEKALPVKDASSPLLAFLAAHGVRCEADNVEIGDRTIGAAVLEYAARTDVTLLVMGAFGHSRMQQFLLGGATKEILDRSTVPLLMSH